MALGSLPGTVRACDACLYAKKFGQTRLWVCLCRCLGWGEGNMRQGHAAERPPPPHRHVEGLGPLRPSRHHTKADLTQGFPAAGWPFSAFLLKHRLSPGLSSVAQGGHRNTSAPGSLGSRPPQTGADSASAVQRSHSL